MRKHADPLIALGPKSLFGHGESFDFGGDETGSGYVVWISGLLFWVFRSGTKSKPPTSNRRTICEVQAKDADGLHQDERGEVEHPQAHQCVREASSELAFCF